MRLSFLLVLLLISLNPAFGAVYQCAAKDEVVLQSIPCEDGQEAEFQEEELTIEIDGIHPSWLASPRYRPEEPTCVNGYCSCSHIESKSLSTNESYFFSILFNLPNDWQNYRTSINNAMESESNEVYQAQELRKAAKYSCGIMLKQRILNASYDDIRNSITSAYETASQNLTDEENRCVKPDIEGWTQDESAKEYVQCLREVSSHDFNEILNTKKQKEMTYRTLEYSLEAFSDVNAYRLAAP